MGIRESHLEVFKNEQVSLSAVAAGGTKTEGRDLDFNIEKPFHASKAKLVIRVMEDAASEGNPTVNIIVRSKPVGGTYVDRWTSKTFTVAELKKGAEIVDMMLDETLDQIVQVAVVNATSDTFTAGALYGEVSPYVGG
jgi:hypothetical protein